MSQRVVDPEAERWNRKYPTFPGVEECVELLRSRNVRGTWVEIICALLEEHATQYLDDLLQAFHAESDARVRNLLVYAIAAADSAKVVPFLADCQRSTDDELRDCATGELEALDTKEARTALFHARRTR